jgi:hypothetical protein
MKFIRNAVIQKLRRSFQDANEQWLSIGLSLAIHFLLLIATNIFANLPDISPRLALRAVALDFVMNNAEESNRIANAKPSATKASRRRSSSLPSRTSDLPISDPKNVERQNYALGNSNFGHEQKHNADDNASSNRAEKLFATTSEPERPLPNVARITPTLMPYKFAMPSSQRKAVLKKINEIVSKPFTMATHDSSFTWETDRQRFQFNLQHFPAQSATGLDELLVGVTTIDGGDTLATQLRMKRLAFSQFAQFVDYWDPQVALHDDEFDGRFHSNSGMVLSGKGGTQPKFRGKVTTASYSIRSSEPIFFIDNREVFLEGLEEGAAPIPLPRVFHGVPKDANHSAGGVHSFTEETWLTFYGDGTYTWHTATAPENEHHGNLSREPNSIISRGRAKLHVKGVIKGKLLVYSENNIIIDGDLLCAQNPETFPQSEDFLGLVSTKDVEIASPDVTGPGDLKIYAAILAKGRFRVPDLYTRQSGTLHIYGSLSAGSISATEPRYATRIRFDKRFERMRPPNFPMTNRYEIAEWDERWMVK